MSHHYMKLDLIMVDAVAPTISEFTIIFSIATLGMLALAMVIVFFVLFYQRKMLENKLQRQKLETEHQEKMLMAALESQEHERERLARDLHDSIGLMLSTIRISLMTPPKIEGSESGMTQQVKTMIDDTIDSVRRISRDLMPPSLERFGFAQAVHEMCNQYAMVSGVKVECLENGSAVSMDKTKEIMLFRIVQELVNNALKHSGSAIIHVSIQWTHLLEVKVADQGVGFNVEEKKKAASGLGLFNIQNRAKILGASLKYDTGPDQGTIVTIKMRCS